MSVQITPIVSTSVKGEGLSEFKVRGKSKAILQRLQSKIERWCEKENINVKKGWR